MDNVLNFYANMTSSQTYRSAGCKIRSYLQPDLNLFFKSRFTLKALQLHELYPEDSKSAAPICQFPVISHPAV
jgi:hypothetical protein